MHARSPNPSPDPGASAQAASAVTAPQGRGSFLCLLAGLLTGLLLGGGMTLAIRRPQPPPIVLNPPPTPVPTATPLPTPTPAPITVYVSGAVQRPGLYSLPAQARVGDALASAGGLLPEADPALINQAQKLWDGVQVHVPLPQQGEATAQPPPGISGPAPLTVQPSTGDTASNRRININTATMAELESLTGIGPSKAAAIIANRPYASIEDLQRVPGIGPKTVEQLADFITVE